jgi:hypothetical protein
LLTTVSTRPNFDDRTALKETVRKPTGTLEIRGATTHNLAGRRGTDHRRLHLADIEQLLSLLDRLVDSGKSVVVIEHHQAVMAPRTGSSTLAPAPAMTAAGSSSRAHLPTSSLPAPPSPVAHRGVRRHLAEAVSFQSVCEERGSHLRGIEK